MRGAGFGVQRTGSSPDPCLTNPYSIRITRLSKVSPAPPAQAQPRNLASRVLGPTALPLAQGHAPFLSRPPTSPDPQHPIERLSQGLRLRVFYCSEFQYNSCTFMASPPSCLQAPIMWSQLSPASVPRVPDPPSSGEEEAAFSAVQAHE